MHSVCLVGASVVSVPASGEVTVRQGDPVTLQCEARGNPPPVITWTRGGALLPTSHAHCPASACLHIASALPGNNKTLI
jgi:hypothetical protein